MSKFAFDKILTKFEKAKSVIPQELGKDATKFFNDSFAKQGWTNDGFQAWKARKRNISPRDQGRAILVDSGALKRAVATSLKSATFEQIRFEVNLPYAQYVNEGTPKMPQRQFIGDSIMLRKELQAKIEKITDAIWQE